MDERNWWRGFLVGFLEAALVAVALWGLLQLAKEGR